MKKILPHQLLLLLFLATAGLSKLSAQLPTVQSAIPLYTDRQDKTNGIARDSQDNIYSAYEYISTHPNGTFFDFYISNQITLPMAPLIGTLETNSYRTDLILVKQNASGSLQWAKRSEGKYRERIHNITVDSNDHLLLAGEISGPDGKYFGNTFSLGDGMVVHGYLSKLDGAGNVIWEKVFQADGTNYPMGTSNAPAGAAVKAVTTDTQGNIYAQIYLHANSVNINGTTFSNQNPPGSINANQQDVIVIKFDANGNTLWAKQITSTMGVNPSRMIVTQQNELLITGNVFGDQYYDGQQYPTLTFGETYITKINTANGQVIWNSKPEGLYYPFGIDVDATGNIYIAGGLSGGTYTFGSDVVQNTSYYMLSSKVLMLKLNSSGTPVWGKTAGRSNTHSNMINEYTKDVKVKSDGHILFMGGLRHQNMDFGNGLVLNNSYYTSLYYPGDIFFAEYTAQGNPIRVKKLGDDVHDSADWFALKSDGSIAFNGTYNYHTNLDNIIVTGGDAAHTNCYMAFMSSWNNPTPPDTVPPTAPTNLNVTGVTINSVSLSWNPATDNVGVTSYDVFMNGVYYGYVTGTTITVTGLTPDTTYTFHVRAKDLYQNVSPNSNTVSATTLAGVPFGTDLYISEYVEGTGNNKAIEITNPTNDYVDLSDYSIRQQINGTGNWVNDLPLVGYLGTDEAFLVMHDQENMNCFTNANMYVYAPMDFDGNDPIGLFKNGVLIDIVGNFNSSLVFGENVSLWRNVFNPSTTFTPSQWDTFPIDYCNDLTYANPARFMNTSEVSSAKNIRIYPNPVSDILHFDQEVSNAKIFALDGKLIMNHSKGKQIRVNHLPAATYLIVGQTKDGKTFSQKFIKK